jgi:hypothetical protein
LFTGTLVFLCIVIVAAWTADATSMRVKHWTITTSSVGPLELGMSLAEVKKAGYSYYPCGGETGGHPCYFKGKLGKVMGFDVNGRDRVKQLMVNVASGSGFAFKTESGVKVGSTVEELKAALHPAHVGDYGYGEAFDIHSGKHRWMTFFATGSTASDTIYSISVSTSRKPPQGR